jgi:hypothetical protein
VSFPFGLRQGIRIGVTGCSVLMIRNFNRSRPTFTTSGPLRRIGESAAGHSALCEKDPDHFDLGDLTKWTASIGPAGSYAAHRALAHRGDRAMAASGNDIDLRGW